MFWHSHEVGMPYPSTNQFESLQFYNCTCQMVSVGGARKNLRDFDCAKP